MRGLLLGLVFFSLLPLIFIRGPFVGVLMWFWVSLMAPQYIVWSSIFSTIPYAFIVAIATLVSLFLFKSEPKFPPSDRTTWLLALLMLWISVTSWFGTGPPTEIYDQWLLAEKMLLMTLVAYTLTNSRERLDQVIAVCGLSIAFFGVKGGVFALLRGGDYRVYGPGNSMIGDNNELGVALTMILPLLFYLLHRHRQSRWVWPMRGIIALTFLGDFFTYSRGALLAVCAMGAVAWLRSRHKLASAVMVVILAAGIWNFAPPQWAERMNTIRSYQKDNSAEERLYMWRLAWVMTLRHPIFGSGFHWSFAPAEVNQQVAGQGFHWPFGGNPTIKLPASGRELPPLINPRAAHSIWFEAVSSHGFPGLIFFLSILLSAGFDARWLVRRARGRPDLAWADSLGRMLQASLVGFAVGGTFASLEFYDGIYAVVIIAAAARRVLAGKLAEVPGFAEELAPTRFGGRDPRDFADRRSVHPSLSR